RTGDAGLPAGPRRRTPGLRREEVARLVSMSVEYYARLEQARGPHPSPRILDAIAGALRLTPAERTHLFRLAGTSPAPPPGPARTVRPYVASLLHRIPEAGAVVTDASYDVIALEPAGRGPAWRPQRGAQPGPPAFPAAEPPPEFRRRGVQPYRGRAAAQRR
ncbi:MAG: helix-turn-helix domain-containing protein, partial [Streptosporangiaceae bacterium]